jgi:AraC-like DNA-binding protein
VTTTQSRSLTADAAGNAYVCSQLDNGTIRIDRLQFGAISFDAADVAIKVGLSRSGFAARFAELVGEPPLGYLTRLRMQVPRCCCATVHRSRRRHR